MTVYTTIYGDLQLDRIDRRILDKFAIKSPPPVPPIKEVEVWGGVTEKIEDKTDKTYLRQLLAYRVGLVRDQFDILSGAINTSVDWQNSQKLFEFIDADICESTYKHWLWFVALDDREVFDNVVDEIFYLSTVTERGIKEAEEVFSVTWFGKSIDTFRIKATEARYTQLFEDREAARFALYTWDDFCDLPGYEQSAIVAQYRLKAKIDYLVRSQT